MAGGGAAEPPEEAREGRGAGAAAGEAGRPGQQVSPPHETPERIHFLPGGPSQAEHLLPTENLSGSGEELHEKMNTVPSHWFS